MSQTAWAVIRRDQKPAKALSDAHAEYLGGVQVAKDIFTLRLEAIQAIAMLCSNLITFMPSIIDTSSRFGKQDSSVGNSIDLSQTEDLIR
jgi:hypothetical protein